MLCGISRSFPLLSRSMGQVAHALLTRPPLSHQKQASGASFDLHVLGTPPAFILSQDQTLMFMFFPNRTQAWLVPFFVFRRYCCRVVIFITPSQNSLWIFRSVLLFSFQCPLSLSNSCFCSYQRQLLYFITSSLLCQELFYLFSSFFEVLRCEILPVSNIIYFISFLTLPLDDSLYRIPNLKSFVKNFFYFFDFLFLFLWLLFCSNVWHYTHIIFKCQQFFYFFTAFTKI